ncbi:MAG: hypothetical protein ACI8VI_001817, partial [Granulosicoccus sp.]
NFTRISKTFCISSCSYFNLPWTSIVGLVQLPRMAKTFSCLNNMETALSL